MHKFEAVLEPLPDGVWKLTLHLPGQTQEMKDEPSPAGLDAAAAKDWAEGFIRAEGFKELLGWLPLEHGKYQVKMTM